MIRRGVLVCLLLLMAAVFGFAQAGELRDYVGLISIRYHPDVVEYMGKFREAFEKKGYSDAAKSIDNYLKGLSGSGFVYVAPDGKNYVLTNEHVIAQSESLSIMFEKLDGAKTSYERLKVLYINEEKDLAILVFDEGVNPFTRGLRFGEAMPDEGGDVFAAGFPGLGNTAIWQFSKGTVSNAAARIPKDDGSDETAGPYIQHTAQIDPGNSGGPLLTADTTAVAGYAVVGINTKSALFRQAANYAIPADQVRAFIDNALNGGTVNERDMVSKAADAFIGGLGGDKAVYGHIAKYLSNACTAINGEYSIEEMLDRAPRTVLNDILYTFAGNPVEGMNAAVAWSIENSMRDKSGLIKITVDSVNPDDKGGFDVTFNVNGELVQSGWVKEYGVYRMNSYGDVVTENKTVAQEKLRKKNVRESVFNYRCTAAAGYGYVFDYGSALTTAVTIGNPFYYSLDLTLGKSYLQAGMSLGYSYPIEAGPLLLSPFGQLGVNYIATDESKDQLNDDIYYDTDSGIGNDFAIGLKFQAGLLIRPGALPRLFSRIFYGYTVSFMKDKNETINNHSMLGFTVGWAF